MEDIRLIKRCQSGDKKAFQELIGKYHPFVFKFLIKNIEDEGIAEDVTQDTFLKIIKNIDKFDVHGSGKFSTYLIAVSKNSYIDYLRKNKKHLQDMEIDESINIKDFRIDIEKTVINKIYSDSVIRELENLSEEQRIAIKLKYMEGLTLKEIGEKLEVEPKTVKSRIHNGIVKLRKILGGDDGYEGG